MRYLPTLEIDGQINQVAFPDIHAIELAEICLATSGSEKQQRLLNLLLKSPMLLFWSFERWVGQSRESIEVPTGIEAFLKTILGDLNQDAHQLIKDHFKPLTSVSRLEVDSFVEIQTFFQCRDESSRDDTEKILGRLAILESRLGTDAASNAENRLQVMLRFDSDFERVVTEFDRTDFSQSVDQGRIAQLKRHMEKVSPAHRRTDSSSASFAILWVLF